MKGQLVIPFDFEYKEDEENIVITLPQSVIFQEGDQMEVILKNE